MIRLVYVDQSLIAQAVKVLIGHRELGPLPVTPAQDPQVYPVVKKMKEGSYCPITKDFKPMPMFTGENLSYLDKQGIPQLINHSQYRSRQPSKTELQLCLWSAVQDLEP
jgi:hypothetical protein